MNIDCKGNHGEASEESMRGLKFSKICKDYGIRICSYQSAPELVKKLGFNTSVSGFAAMIGDRPIIFFNENLSECERFFYLCP